ncbi:MAG: PAS domain-containing protein [Clostridiaceae bacterium]
MERKDQVQADNQNESNSAMEKFSRNLLEASLDPSATIGLNGKIKVVNQAAEYATGLLRDQLIGSDFIEYFSDPNKARAIYQQVLHEGKSLAFELELKNIAGYSTPVLCNASVYKDDDGIIMGVFATARDIKDTKNIKDELIYLKNNLELLINQRAAELVVANKELAFQSGEKADRAAELVVANKELAFQSGEKADRASELVNANKELAFQNSEKDK